MLAIPTIFDMNCPCLNFHQAATNPHHDVGRDGRLTIPDLRHWLAEKAEGRARLSLLSKDALALANGCTGRHHIAIIVC